MQAGVRPLSGNLLLTTNFDMPYILGVFHLHGTHYSQRRRLLNLEWVHIKHTLNIGIYSIGNNESHADERLPICMAC